MEPSPFQQQASRPQLAAAERPASSSRIRRSGAAADGRGVVRVPVKNEFVQHTIDGWPTQIDGSRAERLGIRARKNLQEICTSFLGDYERVWKHHLM
jgi:hypothetical protein